MSAQEIAPRFDNEDVVGAIDRIARVLAEADGNTWMLLSFAERDRYQTLGAAVRMNAGSTVPPADEDEAYEQGWEDAMEEAQSTLSMSAPPRTHRKKR